MLYKYTSVQYQFTDCSVNVVLVFWFLLIMLLFKKVFIGIKSKNLLKLSTHYNLEF